MGPSLFIYLGAVIIIATIVSCLMRYLRQPLIIGYIIAGVLVGPSMLKIIPTGPSMSTLSQFGIALLLFLIGLGLDPKSVKDVGKSALITGLGQVILTGIVGYGIGLALGFSRNESIYIGIGLTLSSTIIVMKLLTDKNEQETLPGKLSIGILIVQDFVALVCLLLVSSFQNGGGLGSRLVETFGLGALLVGALVVVAVYALPKVLNFVAVNQELLFLFSIAWVLLVASLFYIAGFSLEMGALLAGVAISMSPYRYEMSAKVRPLRDFFILMFFISLGSQLTLGGAMSQWASIAIFSIFVLIVNPLIVLALLTLSGYTLRTAFMAGITMAQVSEFSFILLGMGVELGHIRPEASSLVTTVGLITIAGSSYLIINSNKVFEAIKPYISWMGPRNRGKEPSLGSSETKAQVYLFGYNRIGHDLLLAVHAINKDVLVIDYNPETVRRLQTNGVDCRYGDANDKTLLEDLDLAHAKMVISTIPDMQTNLLLIKTVRKRNPRAIIIGVSHQIDEALTLYESGASYVLLPHFLGGTFAAEMIRKYKFGKTNFHKEKKAHLQYLADHKKLGHEHPKISRH